MPGGHTRQARIEERRRPLPAVGVRIGAVGRRDVLDRVAVQRVVEVERETQLAPADVKLLFTDRSSWLKRGPYSEFGVIRFTTAASRSASTPRGRS